MGKKMAPYLGGWVPDYRTIAAWAAEKPQNRNQASDEAVLAAYLATHISIDAYAEVAPQFASAGSDRENLRELVSEVRKTGQRLALLERRISGQQASLTRGQSARVSDT